MNAGEGFPVSSAPFITPFLRVGSIDQQPITGQGVIPPRSSSAVRRHQTFESIGLPRHWSADPFRRYAYAIVSCTLTLWPGASAQNSPVEKVERWLRCAKAISGR
ncbi:metallophosphoesterase [Anopheles sinensis]|uniref:Metallophosphoesterase n=1 Tax=Anopheles sinensis TaxID=74873 RepID=A0A084VHR0_ANOSI|nr:metallophosphoesterase [Anopheles sinensis]